ncbi:MAG: hypothetical protein U0167_07740 [bacterium]
MKPSSRRHAAIYALPMILALVAARHAVPHVRSVDFLLVFAAGAVFGLTLMGVLRSLRAPEDPS